MSSVTARPFAAGAAIVLLVAGCGGGAKDSSANQGGPSPTAVGTSVSVTETDFHIALSGSALKAGEYTFNVKNAGQSTHALEVEGPGVQDAKTGTIQPGDSEALTVTLQHGSYKFWCPVDGHADLGMKMTVSVP